MILEINAEDVIANSRSSLGLPASESDEIDATLMAALLRRSAGILCPCSRTSLRASLLDSLRLLGVAEMDLREKIDAAIDGLITGGDLLELEDVTTSDFAVKSTWVFSAPPRFIMKEDGDVFLAGIVPDQDQFVSSSLRERIKYRRFSRFIECLSGEDIRNELLKEGVQEVSERVWLQAPRPDTPENWLAIMKRHLSAASDSGSINDLMIIDPDRPVKFYRGRWVAPNSKHSGLFVARRPQAYGAPKWCFIELEEGMPSRLLDLPLKRSKWRACDEAWRLQMAIDSCLSHPQLYRRAKMEKRVRFDFFSPLPQWSERRFMIFGNPEPANNCLISYSLPLKYVDQEEELLREQIWISQEKMEI